MVTFAENIIIYKNAGATSMLNKHRTQKVGARKRFCVSVEMIHFTGIAV